jgi:hypothetical protein
VKFTLEKEKENLKFLVEKMKKKSRRKSLLPTTHIIIKV